MDIFRKHHRVLTSDEQEAIAAIKDAAEALWSRYEQALWLHEEVDGRAIAVAKTNLEQSVMWAIKGVTA